MSPVFPFLIVMFVLIVTRVASAVPFVPVQQYTSDDGLAGAVVRGIDRTPDGIMWFACWGRGVSSYDGLAWRSYGLEDGLPSLDVRAVAMDADQRIWAGTADGIAVKVASRWFSVIPGIEGEEPISLFRVAPMPDGSIWFGMTEGRLLVFTPAAESPASEAPAGAWEMRLHIEQKGAIEAIWPSSDGSVLVGTDEQGILRWHDGAWTQEPGSVDVGSIDDIVETELGVLYAGGGSGLWRRGPDDTAWESISKESVRGIGLMDGERVAVAHQDRLVYYGQESRMPIQLLRDNPSVPLQTAEHFREVRETWVGSKLGVFRLGQEGWSQAQFTGSGTRITSSGLYGDQETPATTVENTGEVFQNVGGKWEAMGNVEAGEYHAVFRGRDRTIWMLKSGRAIQWDLDSKSTVRGMDLPAPAAAILETSGGRLFCHGVDNVFERVDGRWIDTPASPRSDVEEVTCAIEINNGDLLVSTLTALTQWGLEDGGMKERFRIESEKNFRGMIVESNGDVLVGSNEEGIYRYRDGQLTYDMPFQKDPSARVRVMFQSSQGAIWIGASEMGLSSYLDGRWKWFSGEHGIPSGGIRAIVEDPWGHIWASVGNAGILCYIRSPDAPETVIQQVPSQIPFQDHSVLQFDGRDPWNITPREELVYSWRIRPEDPGDNAVAWTGFVQERSVITPTLSPGDYVFEVRAADTDFNIDDTPASARFSVLPPLWATKGFIIPLAMLVGAILIALALLLRNVAALRESERHLREAMERAESASRAKSQFLAHVSHEIRTPMNAILGHVQVMQLSGNRSPEDETNLGIITKSGDHLLELINNVLEMAKIEAGSVTLETSTFDFREVVEQVFQMLEVQCDRSRVSLQRQIDDSVPPFIVADRAKVRQILINLLGNAIKFTRAGAIVFRSWAEPVDGDGGTKLLYFDLEDSGEGIEPSSLAGVFEPFEQAAQGRRAGGAGLGLPICKNHVEKMGGRIEVESTVGMGTTVHAHIKVGVGLERDVIKEKEIGGPLDGSAQNTNTRILVVDDIDTNLSVMEKLLVRFDFDVTGVTNGPEAIQVFSTWKPDVILMDRTMPEMDGIETTRIIRSMPGGGDIPIIFVTGGALDEERQEIMACGATAIIRKPFRHRELLEKIEEYLHEQ